MGEGRGRVKLNVRRVEENDESESEGELEIGSDAPLAAILIESEEWLTLVAIYDYQREKEGKDPNQIRVARGVRSPPGSSGQFFEKGAGGNGRTRAVDVGGRGNKCCTALSPTSKYPSFVHVCNQGDDHLFRRPQSPLCCLPIATISLSLLLPW